MYLTEENYYSQEANWEFLSVSQYKDFMGTMGKPGCEARAMAKLKGEWVEAPSTAMLVGSYVDAHFEGTLDCFKAKHPDFFKKDGSLKAEYIKAEEVIERIERDEFFMQCMAGEKQVILTAELFGAKWKGKLDSYHKRGSKTPCIVDLKVVKDLHERFWIKDLGAFVSFIEFWGYDLQGAIYQLLEQATYGGESLPFLIAAADKTKYSDIDVIGFNQNDFDKALIGIEGNVQRIVQLKAGKLEPTRCGKCDYCKFTKKLTAPISTEFLIEV